MCTVSKMVTPKAGQSGSLMLVTLIILLVISLIGMSTVDTTGLEMHMTSNSRQQQQVFEAAEYALSMVENNLYEIGDYTNNQLTNTSCGSVCFSTACTGGYCFNGTNPNTLTCTTLTAAATEPYRNSAIWTTGSGKYQTIVVPIPGLASGITVQYIIEYWCVGQRNTTIPLQAGNTVNLYRITVLASGESGRARSMLRSTVHAK